MSRILISGGNGFLGTYLTESAINRGFEVVVVDDMSTSIKKNVPPEAVFVKERIEDYEDTTSYDFVVHLAARPSPEDYMSDPISTLVSNSLGTKTMLDMALRSNAVFFYTSSSEIYGEATIIPTPESYYGYVSPNGVRSCYDEGKRYSEALIQAYHRQFGLDTRVQRPFNVYGPRIRADGQYGRVIPRFVLQALRNEPISIHGDGLQTRSFLYVSDWLRGTESQLYSKDSGGTVLNIGSISEITILDLAKQILELTHSESEITFLDKRVDDPTRRAADIGLLMRLFNWEPRVSFREGLESTIEWLRRDIS